MQPSRTQDVEAKDLSELLPLPLVPIPPILYAGFWVAGFHLQLVLPLAQLPVGWPGRLALGLPLVAASVAIPWAATVAFWQKKTPMYPVRPVTAVVTAGPFRYTRNPWYLSAVLLYAGVGLVANAPWVLALAPFLVLVLDRVVIAREERYLARRFGAEYLAFKGRVRRWL